MAYLNANVVAQCGWTWPPLTPFTPVALGWTQWQVDKACKGHLIQTYMYIYRKDNEWQVSHPRATWRTLEANVIVGAGATIRLFLVNAPEALIQTGVDHLPSVSCRHPVRGASLHGDWPWTNPLPVVEADGFQSLVVSVASRVVDVEPRRPFCHTWGK